MSAAQVQRTNGNKLEWLMRSGQEAEHYMLVVHTYSVVPPCSNLPKIHMQDSRVAVLLGDIFVAVCAQMSWGRCARGGEAHQATEPPHEEGCASELVGKEDSGEAGHALHKPPPEELAAVHGYGTVRVQRRLERLLGDYRC